MFNWLRSRRPQAEDRPNPVHFAASVDEQEPVARAAPEPNLEPAVPLESALRDMLFGLDVPADDRSPLAEGEVLRRIDAIILSPSTAADVVPRLPAILPRVMKSLRSEETTAKDIADQIRRDATLVAEVVRLANSPYYCARQQITSLEHATFALGRNGLRQLIANVAFKPVFSDRKGRFSSHARAFVWEQAERCAAAAKFLALDTGDDEFDAYIAGLVHNIGLTVVMKLMDDCYVTAGLGPPATGFCDELLARARRLSSLVVQGWEFPPKVVSAIQEQTGVTDTAPMSSLGRVLWMADRLSAIHLLATRGTIERVDKVLAPYFPADLLQAAEQSFATLEAFEQADRSD